MGSDSKKKIREWLEAFLIASAIALVMFFICWPLQVEGTSMENTLYGQDRVFVSRVLPLVNPIASGDLIVCDIKEVDKDNKKIIKRVIGLPNDHIAISGGKVYVNDIELNETYIKDEYTNGDIDMILEDGEYFVMGDNRKTSKDSRLIGIIKKEKIVGKVFFKFYPFNKMSAF